MKEHPSSAISDAKSSFTVKNSTSNKFVTLKGGSTSGGLKAGAIYTGKEKPEELIKKLKQKM